jgi:hypothetical protein
LLKELQLDDAAPWKRRLRLPLIFGAQVARKAPTRGLAVGNHSGTVQLYAWDVSSGDLRQRTNRPEGVSSGVLSPDGRYAYYLDDLRGNEIGHYVRVPYEGGPPRT